MNSGQPPTRKIQAEGLAENSDELTWRRLFSFQLILVSKFLFTTVLYIQ